MPPIAHLTFQPNDAILASARRASELYVDRGVHCTVPQVHDLYSLYPQVKGAAYVKILSKRL